MRALTVLAIAFALALPGCMSLLPGEEPLVPAGTSEEAPPPVAEASPTPPTREPTPASPATPSNATAPPPPTELPPESTPEPTRRVERIAWNGTLTAAGAPPPAWAQVHAAAENVQGTFEVPAGLAGIVVELVWTDPHFDLDLDLAAPDAAMAVPPSPSPADPGTRTGHFWTNAAGTPGAPDGHATLALTDAEALALIGTWTWGVLAKGPANAVPFAVHVSLFHGERPPDGYSALASPSDNP